MLIVLPLPPRECSPNWRGHWTKRAAAVKCYREHAWAEALANIHMEPGMPWRAATVKCHFVFKRPGRRDKDNLLARMKAAFDGFADAGMVADDADFTYQPVSVAVDRDNPRVEVTITEAMSDNPNNRRTRVAGNVRRTAMTRRQAIDLYHAVAFACNVQCSVKDSELNSTVSEIVGICEARTCRAAGNLICYWGCWDRKLTATAFARKVRQLAKERGYA
jgi:Holliday junction resolvase RusA-like endonuclease